jgi:hypothetical protein
LSCVHLHTIHIAYERNIMDEAINKLQLLNNKQLTRIILWLIRDLLNWSKNDRVRDDLRTHSAMILEAFLYQINKETINEEE